MNLLQFIEKAASKSAPGRAPSFSEAHLVKALKVIDSEAPVGRVKLARTLGLGEGSARTLIKHLENERLIETLRSGIVFTKMGKRISLNLKSRISDAIEVPQSSLTVGSFNIALLVKGASSAVKGGLEQRDAAIKIGALGATTLVFSRGRLNMPRVDEDVFRNSSFIRETLLSKLKPQEKDVIIIGSAHAKSTAELGVIAAALETLKVTNQEHAASTR